MKRLIQTLCLVIAFTSLAAGQTFSRKPWSYLKADANDTARILTNDKTDTLPISHDGNNWWIGDGDTTWFDNHIVYIGNVDSSGGNVMLIFKNAVDSFGIRLNSGANGEYTNDFNTWNEFGTGGSGSSIPVFEDNTQKEDALQRLKFGSDFDVTLTTNDTTKVTLESHLESVAASADSLDRKVYMQGDTMMPTATHNLYLGDQQSKTAIAVTAYKVDTTDAGAEYVTQDELSAATSVGVNDSITKYAIRKDGSNSPTAAVSWGSQNLTTVNALGVTKIKLAADADTVQSLANSANDGLIITAQNLKVSADSTNFAANTIGSTDLNNADVFQFGGLGLNTTKSTSWALLIQSLRKEGGYNGIAIQDTAKDSMVGINLYAYNAAGTQQSGGIYLNPGNTPLTQAYWSFKLPTTFTKDDYDKLRIYADSVQMRTYVSLIPSARIAGGWLEMDTIYMGTVPLWHDTTIASEGELEDSLDNYYNATTIQAAIEDSLDNYYNATTIQAAIEDSLDNYYNQTAIAAGFFSTADFDNETIDTTAAGKLRVIGAGTAKNADTLGHVAYMQGDTIMGSYYYGDQQSKTAAAVGMYEKDTTNANAKYSTNAEVDTVIEDSLDNYLLLGDTANQLRTNRVDTIPTNVVNTAYPWADDEVADNITASGYLTLGDTVNQVRTNRVDTITANLVNTAYPWADNEVADNITAGHATTADTAGVAKDVALSNVTIEQGLTVIGPINQYNFGNKIDLSVANANFADSHFTGIPFRLPPTGSPDTFALYKDSDLMTHPTVVYIPNGWPHLTESVQVFYDSLPKLFWESQHPYFDTTGNPSATAWDSIKTAKRYFDGGKAYYDTTQCTGACDSVKEIVVRYYDTTDCNGVCDSTRKIWVNPHKFVMAGTPYFNAGGNGHDEELPNVFMGNDPDDWDIQIGNHARDTIANPIYSLDQFTLDSVYFVRLVYYDSSEAAKESTYCWYDTGWATTWKYFDTATVVATGSESAQRFLKDPISNDSLWYRMNGTPADTTHYNRAPSGNAYASDPDIFFDATSKMWMAIRVGYSLSPKAQPSDPSAQTKQVIWVASSTSGLDWSGNKTIAISAYEVDNGIGSSSHASPSVILDTSGHVLAFLESGNHNIRRYGAAKADTEWTYIDTCIFTNGAFDSTGTYPFHFDVISRGADELIMISHCIYPNGSQVGIDMAYSHDNGVTWTWSGNSNGILKNDPTPAGEDDSAVYRPTGYFLNDGGAQRLGMFYGFWTRAGDKPGVSMWPHITYTEIQFSPPVTAACNLVRAEIRDTVIQVAVDSGYATPVQVKDSAWVAAGNRIVELQTVHGKNTAFADAILSMPSWEGGLTEGYLFRDSTLGADKIDTIIVSGILPWGVNKCDSIFLTYKTSSATTTTSCIDEVKLFCDGTTQSTFSTDQASATAVTLGYSVNDADFDARDHVSVFIRFVGDANAWLKVYSVYMLCDD